jgi:hypothetical protein
MLAKCIHSVVTDMDFPYVVNDNVVNINYHMLFQLRKRYQYLQEWHDCIYTMPKIFITI